jgi:hypothetical protein
VGLVVGAELAFEHVCGLTFGAGHDTSILDRKVELVTLGLEFFRAARDGVEQVKSALESGAQGC